MNNLVDMLVRQLQANKEEQQTTFSSQFKNAVTIPVSTDDDGKPIEPETSD